MKKVFIIVLIYLVGLIAVLSLCARAEQINNSNEVQYENKR